MDAKTVVLERSFNASVDTIWDALTNIDRMKEWYFDFDAFKPEAGFEFKTLGGSDEIKYLHLLK
jgi:uncharacterized protein YndB with AHSA1/START domain